jgi:PEP-CTERM motif
MLWSHCKEFCMKLMTLAATTLMLVAGHAAAQGSYQVGTDAWAKNIDFASASGIVSETPATLASSSPLGPVEFGSLPPPALVPGSDDPVMMPPPSGETGPALADNIAVANNAVNGFINVSQVPEPSALLMMLAGVGAIGFVIYRRRGEG